MTAKKSSSSMQQAIAKHFKELRGIMGLTQKEMAEKMETTQANISQIENGECIPNGIFFLKLANLYPETNFNWLLYQEGSPKKTDELSRLKALIAQETERKIEKRHMKTYDELNSEIARLREDNSKLINIVSKKNK